MCHTQLSSVKHVRKHAVPLAPVKCLLSPVNLTVMVTRAIVIAVVRRGLGIESHLSLDCEFFEGRNPVLFVM